MSDNPLNLNQLTMDDIDFAVELPKVTARLDKIEKECKEKYGDNWWEHYIEITCLDIDKDPYEEVANNAIYGGVTPFLTGDPKTVYKMHTRYEEKMRELFGRFWRRHIHHKPNDSKINKLLIKDALKTGKWRELPKQLHDEYHRQAERAKKNIWQ